MGTFMEQVKLEDSEKFEFKFQGKLIKIVFVNLGHLKLSSLVQNHKSFTKLSSAEGKLSMVASMEEID